MILRRISSSIPTAISMGLTSAKRWEIVMLRQRMWCRIRVDAPDRWLLDRNNHSLIYWRMATATAVLFGLFWTLREMSME